MGVSVCVCVCVCVCGGCGVCVCEVVCLADEVKMLTIQDQRRTSEVPANNSRVGRSLPVPREQRGKFYNENKHGDNGNVAMKAFTAVSKQAVPGRVRGTAWTRSKLVHSAFITAGETETAVKVRAPESLRPL